MAIYKRICEKCKNEFNADKKNRKFCSVECRVVPKECFDGVTSGWLTVVKEVEGQRKPSGSLKRMFECKCKCGNVVIKSYDGIFNKGYKTPSCGCFMHWHATYNRIKHGMTNTDIYHVWASLKARCYKPNHPSYKNYGARGIKVCERWSSFENFYDDMSSTYEEGLTLDRYPDMNGNYDPSNCRWATYKQQMRNVRNNRMLNVRGYVKCASEFAEILGYKVSRLFGRLGLNWSHEEAVLGRDKQDADNNFKKIIEYYESDKK